MSQEDLPPHALTLTVLMTPETANFTGNVHGGHLLRMLDQVAYSCASRFTRHYGVTAAVDRVWFRQAVHVGELVTFLASVTLHRTRVGSRWGSGSRPRTC